LIEAKRRAGLLKGFPDLPACQTCPLSKDSIDSRSSIPDLEAQSIAIAEKIKNGESVIARYAKDIFDVIEERKNNFVAIDTVALKTERNKLLVQGNKIPEYEAILTKAANAKNEVSKIDGMIEAARNNVKETDKEITVATEAFSKTSYNDDAHQKVINAANLLNFQVKKISGDISNSNIELGKFKARLEQHVARRNEANVLLKDIAQKEANAAVYEALSKAFGRDGIPQLIVDSAIPHLQEIMFDLMSEIDSKFAIRITTQRETQKGTTQERIEILVDDGDDERDISTYSGGEMNLLSTVIRIAFSILQAERSGKGLKVLVLDEAMYFADNEYSDAFMRMLKKLPQFFNQIFIISHSEFVLSSIENKIFFARTSNGKTTVQTDFK
jgi:DNA repair exonuclease SbcCD ATPase subunit